MGIVKSARLVRLQRRLFRGSGAARRSPGTAGPGAPARLRGRRIAGFNEIVRSYTILDSALPNRAPAAARVIEP